MPVKLDAPIPGQSLTMEPGNQPWEQPPEYADPEDALRFYLEKFEDEELVDDILFALDGGFPLDVLVDSTLTNGVMRGLHTIDVSIIIGPVLHEYLLAVATEAGVKVLERQDDLKIDERKAEKFRKRSEVMVKRALQEAGAEIEAPTMADEETDEEGPVEEISTEPAPSKGLMGRKQ